MKEEEEVFQPLLMKYFTEEELVEMKIVVIKSHMQQRKAPSSSREANHDLESDEAVDSTKHIDDLPSEIFLKIFSNLSNSELLKAAQVSRRWNETVYDRSNWKSLDMSNWLTSKGTCLFLI